MNPVLVAFGSTEGHTHKIAATIAARLRAAGQEVHLVDTASSEARHLSPIYAGAVLGASVHQGSHQSAFMRFLHENGEWLAGMPVAIFSVSLAAVAASADEEKEARINLDALVAESGLRPVAVRCIAGALCYTRQDYLKRLLMRLIAQQRGGPTDAGADHEFTDWDDVDRFTDEFARSL